MPNYSLSHVSDRDLLQLLASLLRRDRATTAAILACIAEVDARRLYLPRGYASMFMYCVLELQLSEASAYQRISAARTARRFPAILDAVAEGRLHLSAVNLLAPYLRLENATELLEAAVHKTRLEIETLLAQRFPQTEPLPLVTVSSCQLAPERVSFNPDEHGSIRPGSTSGDAAPEGERCVTPSLEGTHSTRLAPERVEALDSTAAIGAPLARAGDHVPPRSSVAPIAWERFEVRLSVGQSTYDKLQHAQSLMSHEASAGDLAHVLDRALDALILRLEKRKFAATDRPQEPLRPTLSERHIPAHVKRAVWKRDGGRCTYVTDAGQRCAARTRLEFDHVEPVARGGRSEIDNVRLRCRAHNQYAADCEFGRKFMDAKRESRHGT